MQESANRKIHQLRYFEQTTRIKWNESCNDILHLLIAWTSIKICRITLESRHNLFSHNK